MARRVAASMPGIIPPVWYRSLWDELHPGTVGVIEWVGLVTAAVLLAIAAWLLVKRRDMSEASLELHYSGGYPGVEGPLTGELAICDETLCFRDPLQPARAYFQAPLADVVTATAEDGRFGKILQFRRNWGSLDAVMLFGLRNYLTLRIRDPHGVAYTLWFSAHRYSRAPWIWQQRLQQAAMSKPVLPQQSV